MNAHALRPRPGRWVQVTRTRGCGGQTCSCCGETVERGWSFYETDVLSTAFLCDGCVEMIVEGKENRS